MEEVERRGRCNGRREHSPIEGRLQLPSGTTMAVSEWAGRYTDQFATALVIGVERALQREGFGGQAGPAVPRDTPLPSGAYPI